MTTDEVREACTKFTNYLRSNGVIVDAHILMFNGDMVVGAGNKDKAQLMIVAAVADMMGYRLEPI